jgi:hypothetical protein
MVVNCGVQKAEDNQQYVLGRVLKLIRFPLMSSEEFSAHVAQDLDYLVRKK